MRAVFTCILLSVVLFASPERKIIVGSFATEQGAQRALKKFQAQLGADFLAAQQRLGFAVVARPSGRQYIIALEPFPSYKEAKKVKKMLPKRYASAFINKYVPPAVLPLPVATAPAVSQKQEALTSNGEPNATKKTEAIVSEDVVKISADEIPIQQESNTTHKSDVNATAKPVSVDEVRLPSASQEASYIVDAVTMKLIDAKKAYYAVEGQTYGIMSPSGKFAFAQKEVAQEFVKQYGGRVVDYATMKQLEQKEAKR